MSEVVLNANEIPLICRAETMKRDQVLLSLYDFLSCSLNFFTFLCLRFLCCVVSVCVKTDPL